MKKFLSIFLLFISVFATDTFAQGGNMQSPSYIPYGSQPGRFLINGTANTAPGYEFYCNYCDVQWIEKTANVDSCNLQFHDSGVTITTKSLDTGSVNLTKLVLDTVNCTITATGNVAFTTPAVIITSTTTPIRVYGNGTVNAAGSDTGTLTNFPVAGNPTKFLKIVQKATAGGTDSVYVMPLWRVSP